MSGAELGLAASVFLASAVECVEALVVLVGSLSAVRILRRPARDTLDGHLIAAC